MTEATAEGVDIISSNTKADNKIIITNREVEAEAEATTRNKMTVQAMVEPQCTKNEAEVAATEATEATAEVAVIVATKSTITTIKKIIIIITSLLITNPLL